MIYKEVNICDIKPYDNNPRINEGTAEQLAKVIKEYGFINPVLLDKNGVIIAGHTRYKAAVLNGLKTLPAIYIEDFTKEQTSAFRLADNKTAEKATWDYVRLQEELRKIISINLGEFGLNVITDKMLDDIQIVAPEKTEARIKTVICPYCGKETKI